MRKNSSQSWYGASQVTKLGVQLTKTIQPVESNELTDLELLAAVTRSTKFAKQFLEKRKLEELLLLDSPRELLLFPSATPAVVARAWSLVEFYARISERLPS